MIDAGEITARASPPDPRTGGDLTGGVNDTTGEATRRRLTEAATI